MKHLSRWLIGGLALLGLAAIVYLWSQFRPREAPAPIAAPDLAVVEAPLPPPEPLHHAIEAITPPPEAPLPPLADTGTAVSDALVDLLGRHQVLSFLDERNFARHVVATVDNLARSHSASRLWPVLPAPGRFLVSERDGASYMAEANAQRYAAFVRFVSAIDPDAAVALYVRMYPMLQEAYVDLGYPGRYFNNRLVEVIDQLLATPDLSGPVQLILPEVKGPGDAPRPWVRYQFADPTLERRPAGQKILMRMGPENARQLKAKLRQILQRIAPGSVTG